MIVERNENEVTFRLSSKKLTLKELQAIADWLECIELTGTKAKSPEKAQKLSKQAKKGRWERLSSNLGI
jgi:hypothetical protein